MRTIAEIAQSLGLPAEGDLALAIDRPAHPEGAGRDDLALAMDPKYLATLEAALGREDAPRAAMVPAGADWRALGLSAAILVERARFAMAGVTRLFAAPLGAEPGVHPSAVVAAGAEIGEGAIIGPLTVIQSGARIGAGSHLVGQATVGAGAVIGDEALVYPGVRIGRDVRIGARAIIHPNACIGSDGFSFVTPEKGAVEAAKASGAAMVEAETRNRVWARIHSLGAVEIGDDVEIGAGTTIDRGTVADTRIGDGTKIDNQVQIGHNVQIGRNCLLCGQAGVAGSAELGDRVVLGGQSGVADHARLGSDVMVMATSGVSGMVKSGTIVGGTPAVPRDELAALVMAQRRLPRLAKELQALKKRFPDDDANS